MHRRNGQYRRVGMMSIPHGISYCEDSDDEYHVKDGRVHARGYNKSLGKRMHDLFLASEYCDVTLVTRTATFKAHKVVIAASSDYFKAMFSTKSVEAQSSVVSFKDNPSITSAGLSAVLEFMYLGSLQVSTVSLREILEAARHLLMTDVTKSCKCFIADELNLDNFSWLLGVTKDFDLDTCDYEYQCEHILGQAETNIRNYLGMLKLAVHLNSKKVLANVVPFIARELPNLLGQEEFLDVLDTITLRCIVKKYVRGFSKDITPIQLVVDWVGRSPGGRKLELSDLMAEINFFCFEVETLDAVAEMSYIRDDETTKRLISEAKSHLMEDCDSYLFTMSGNAMKFHCITNLTGSTKTVALNIPSKTRGRSVAISGPCSFIAVGDILFICDRPDAQGESPCCSYDARRNTAKPLAFLPGHRSMFKMVGLGGEVYAIGGKEFMTHGRATDSCKVDIYNFSADQWQSGTPLPRAFNSIRAAVLNDSIYVYGISLTGSSAFVRYNQDSGSWESKENSSFNGLDIGMMLPCGGYLYRFIDSPSVSPTDSAAATPLSFDMERYNPTVDHWTSSTVQHSFEGFRMVAGLEHMGKMHIVGSYTRKTDTASRSTGNNTTALFRFDEAAGRIELVKNNLASASKNLAMLRIPRKVIARFAE